MKYMLSFGTMSIISDNIVEVIMDEGTVMTLEMCEEYDAFLIDHFHQDFGVLVNRVHNYTYTFEAKLHIASLENLKAIAVITYNKQGSDVTRDIVKQRAVDNWNIKEFSGLQMGRNKALNWLENELLNIHINQ